MQVQVVYLKGNPKKPQWKSGEVRQKRGKESQKGFSKKNLLMSRLPLWATRGHFYWLSLRDDVETPILLAERCC